MFREKDKSENESQNQSASEHDYQSPPPSQTDSPPQPPSSPPTPEINIKPITLKRKKVDVDENEPVAKKPVTLRKLSEGIVDWILDQDLLVNKNIYVTYLEFNILFSKYIRNGFKQATNQESIPPKLRFVLKWKGWFKTRKLIWRSFWMMNGFVIFWFEILIFSWPNLPNRRLSGLLIPIIPFCT